jgi:aspartate aminotransferase
VSPTVAVAQRATALKASGLRILDFSVGEPDQPTPDSVTAAGVAALRAGRTRYAPASGLPELREAICRRYAQDEGVTFDPSEVAVAVGGKQALYLACQALLGAGDEAVVPTPGWPTFAECARLAGARPVFVRTREERAFKLTARGIARAVTPRTRVVVLNTPSNPTGAVIDAGDLAEVARLARRRGFTVLYDDTYARLSFDGGPSGLDVARRVAPDHVVVVGTASKTYCMTGWRIGWVLGPRAVVDACAAIASHSTQSPATFAQVAAVEALDGPQDAVRALAAEYRRRRDFIHPKVAALPGVSCVCPEGGFYLFPRLEAHLSPAVSTTVELATRLLEDHGVALVPGEGFGAPGFARLSFARPMDELREGAARLAAFFSGAERK